MSTTLPAPPTPTALPTTTAPPTPPLTPNSSTRRTIKNHSSEEIKTLAAKKIKAFFLNKIRKYKRNQPDECSTEPVVIKPDNIYISLKKGRAEIPLVNFFRFKKKEGIIEPNFFTNFYNYMKRNVNANASAGKMVCKIKLEDNFLYINAHSIIKKTPELQNYAFKFIFYNLMNINNMNLLRRGVTVMLNHPANFSDIIGVHKDDTIYTCLTYMNSPVTTEIAFDTEIIKLDWLQCSPLFRFDTRNQITTLCFADQYILHTIPIYEEEGMEPYELNNFDPNRNMIETIVDEKPYLDFGFTDTRNNNKWKTENLFLKQEHRKKIQKPEHREILACFIFGYDDIPQYAEPYFTEYADDYEFEFDMNEVQKYKLDFVQEKIELTKDSVETIRTTQSLGSFELTGGKKKKNNKRTKKNLDRSRYIN